MMIYLEVRGGRLYLGKMSLSIANLIGLRGLGFRIAQTFENGCLLMRRY